MTTVATVDPLTVMEDLFGDVFGGPSWQAWRACISGMFGLSVTAAQGDLIHLHTGRQEAQCAGVREAWLIIGRRGGKSQVAAFLAVYLACFRPYTLTLGERGTVMLIAADRRQARVLMRYVSGLLHAVPMLRAMLIRETRQDLELNNGITIEIHTASFRAVRGYTVVAAVLDELAFWPTDDAASPDVEILNALRPAMATVPGALLLAISSPYARRGELWRAYKGHYGKDGDPVFVWQADTRSMNPIVPQDVIDRAYADDEPRARAEYGATFRRDIESYLPREAIEAVTVPGRYELPPVPGVDYLAFVDPSGGSADSMTLAIAHRDQGRGVLDAIREVTPPFSPEQVVREFATVLRTYRIHRVTGDRYGGEWPRERFQMQRVVYSVADYSKSELYRELLPMLNSGQVDLLDHARLLMQLGSLERRTARGGRDSIDHAPGGHDDVANAVAGALVLTARKPWPRGATW